MARVEIPMPQMGESIAEGTVSVWLKKPGDLVERDEPILEIATDKVDAEIPSPVAGTLVEVRVGKGETVEVGTVVACIETDAAAAAAAQAGGVLAPGPRPEAQRTVAAGTAESGSLEDRLRSRSSPLVRRIAEEHGVPLGEIRGSGRMGRVTKDDILAFVETHGPAPAAGRVRPVGVGMDADFPVLLEHPTVEVRPGDRVEPMSRMTSLIAEHMVLSRRISPHVHSYFEIDYSRIDQVRAASRRGWEEQGVKVSYTAFIVRAVALALREHPRVNAAVSGTDVVYRSAVNVGVAVALPWGLIVPVVRDADGLSLVGLARRIDDLAERARAKRLSPEEVREGTFTVTNPGVFGTVIGFPIIHQPQVAILCVGAVEKRPVVIQDEFGLDAIVARKRGFLALGYDHRVVNGADADQFLARVKQIMESVAPEAA